MALLPSDRSKILLLKHSLVFAKMINPPSSGQSVGASSSAMTMSLCKAADLRMKHLEQLRYLQQLMEDNLISESELKKMNKIRHFAKNYMNNVL